MDSRVQVGFVNPEKFTGLKADASGTRKARDGYLEQLKEHLVRQAGSQIPQGQRPSISIINIELAGEFEPWQSQGLTKVRIIKDLNAPGIDLSFKVTGAKGKVLREGSRELRNLTFMINAASNRLDPLKYEKKLLDDWLRRDVARKN